MSDPISAAAHAYLPDQHTITGDWDSRQFITLELLFDSDENPDAAWAPLTPHEARDLAFALLVLAEHAERRAQDLR